MLYDVILNARELEAVTLLARERKILMACCNNDSMVEFYYELECKLIVSRETPMFKE